MRIARKLFLLCAMAIAATALMATTAVAQETAVEVVEEATHDHCDPCFVEASSITPSEIVSHIFGHEELASTCVDTFEAEIYEDGTGHITDQELDDPPVGTCTQQPCAETAAEEEWPITEAGELGPGLGHMDVRFCLSPENDPETERHCDAEIEVVETGPHHYTLHTDQNCPITLGVSSEVTGEWEIHDNPIEIEHL